MASKTMVCGVAALLAIPLALAAQSLPAEWEVREWALALGKQMDLLGPAIANVDTAKWSTASAIYGEQRDVAAREAGYAATAARELAAKPLGLGKAFELHLRVQAVEGLVASLASGARDNQASTNEAEDILAEARAPLNKLRDYIMDLAISKDRELAAIDSEAQRCRAEMLRTPRLPAAPAPAQKRTKANTNPSK